MTSSGGIFVSYRRDDTAAAAGRLADLLIGRFGASRVFMDVDTIDYGQDFVQRIDQAIAGCDVLLAPIGTKWLDAVNERGQRRIDDPNDFVATEIGTALRRGIAVIPILVDGARMVDATALPAKLSGLARRNATSLDRDSFAADARRILDAVQRIVDTADLRRSGRPRNRTDPPPSGTPDSVEEIAAVLAARSGRRTRRWWGTYLLAIMLVQVLWSVVVAQSPTAKLGASWGLLAVVLGGLGWCVAELRREIAAQRLLVGQLPTMAKIESIRRAVSPRRVRFVAVICLVVAMVVGLGSATSSSRAADTAVQTTGNVR
ncbi:toll/interleukin-1 receptor domain-containing protein [Pseudonocardia humida]|uniref:Toll/interleukin-1 receptor domain-containing protein n=1 Tax=Pseudonocardia humida TaxID=2800819 RepID=A0ABT1A2B7_9PSEU|nr:toll/interleukin-1 receptor domain-containing protein [Pseudonocardia humida]MCO1657135.1 toll/interleukin-1 receptor domain-containing protein [Pseudonocardia humida]